MKKQIDVQAILKEFEVIAKEKGKQYDNTNMYPAAFGSHVAMVEILFISLADTLTPKQKKIIQAELDMWNSTRTKKVQNLMTGQMVEIPYNTPWSCDPSSETYWSM